MMLQRFVEVLEIKGQYADVNGLKMHYLDHGKGDPLILLHGGTGTAEFNWKDHIPILAEKFRIIAPDSRGRGRTNNPSGLFSYKLMAEDVVSLIRTLNIESPLICGWSDGGQIALEIGINYPDIASAFIVGGALYKITDDYKSGLKSWGIIGPGNIDFNHINNALSEFTEVWSDLHSAIYGKEYWKKITRRYFKNVV